MASVPHTRSSRDRFFLLLLSALQLLASSVHTRDSIQSVAGVTNRYVFISKEGAKVRESRLDILMSRSSRWYMGFAPVRGFIRSTRRLQSGMVRWATTMSSPSVTMTDSVGSSGVTGAPFASHGDFCAALSALRGDPLECEGGRIVIFRGNARAKVCVTEMPKRLLDCFRQRGEGNTLTDLYSCSLCCGRCPADGGGGGPGRDGGPAGRAIRGQGRTAARPHPRIRRLQPAAGLLRQVSLRVTEGWKLRW